MEKRKIEGDFVLDSSVLIKWFSNEEYTDIALQIRDDYTKGNISIVCPDLIIYEIANALRYNKLLKEKDIKDAMNSILKFF